MDLIILASDITDAVLSIYFGRMGFATRGKAEEGRISYETGIASAMLAFQEVQSTVDPQTLLLAEYTFITQEFQFCDKSDKDAINSLTRAIQDFDDAFLSLQIVEDSSAYKKAEKTYPHYKDYRVGSYPKDAFHIACSGHKTRIKNVLRAPGIDPIEKTLLKQRLVNLSAAQNGYIEKQKKALANDGNPHSI